MEIKTKVVGSSLFSGAGVPVLKVVSKGLNASRNGIHS